jgi:GNAT superfamily N-acetyltransferase
MQTQIAEQNLVINLAGPQDVAQVLTLIKELAEYEKLSHVVVASEELLHQALFGEQKKAECLLAYHQGKLAGFALFFHNFSTFVGRAGLYIEDIYVREAYRGLGIGKTLFLRLKEIAKERKCGRMEWSVLDWNKPAIDFYKSMDAIAMDEWTVYRLSL